MNLVASVLSCYSSLKQLRRQDGSEISWAFDRALSRVFKRPFGLDLALGLNPAPQLWCWKRSRCNLWGEARGKKRPCTFSIFSEADTGRPYVVSNKMEAGVGAVADTTGTQKEKIHGAAGERLETMTFARSRFCEMERLALGCSAQRAGLQILFQITVFARDVDG